MLDYLKVGGPILYLLLIISVFALGIILERCFYFYKNQRYLSQNEKATILEAVSENKTGEVLEYVGNIKVGTALVIKNFFAQYVPGKTIDQLHEELRIVACEEIGKFSKYLVTLEIIAFVSPMLGMLGTVTGMINSFSQIAMQGSGNPQIVAAGISEALLTTAAGLMIAIPAAVIYNILNKKISEMEEAIDFMGTKIISIVGR